MIRNLADKIRPTLIDEIQNINESFPKKLQSSLILYGPPGSGKTTYAKAMIKSANIPHFSLTAVETGTQSFKDIFQKATPSEPIIIHVDEIHHFNKSQQDIFLPHIEKGSIILIGTTTENPSFTLRPALLSRCRVLTFQQHSETSLKLILDRAENFIGKRLNLSDDAKLLLFQMAAGDARYFLNMVEELYNGSQDENITVDTVSKILSGRQAIYDKAGDAHYSLISAFHKSIRGSDANAALYWYARMLEGGENPLYIARRIVRIAVEDIGLADPNALTQAISAQQAYAFLGSPEGELAIAQAVIYMATAPKSNAAYTAYKLSRKLASDTRNTVPPKHIINAPTQFMKDQGFFKDYIYDHDTPNCFSGQNYFPDEFKNRPDIYKPVERGYEREINKRLKYWNNLRKSKN
ncbi:MAG: replication-associated recombination protein A [Alphaproteobacteria bacterium]|nr:replication-associated recombination protein A [Alphaproteobacteria bacterium]